MNTKDTNITEPMLRQAAAELRASILNSLPEETALPVHSMTDAGTIYRNAAKARNVGRHKFAGVLISTAVLVLAVCIIAFPAKASDRGQIAVLFAEMSAHHKCAPHLNNPVVPGWIPDRFYAPNPPCYNPEEGISYIDYFNQSNQSIIRVLSTACFEDVIFAFSEDQIAIDFYDFQAVFYTSGLKNDLEGCVDWYDTNSHLLIHVSVQLNEVSYEELAAICRSIYYSE